MSNITASIPFQPFSSEAMVEELLSRGFDLSAYAEPEPCHCDDADIDDFSTSDLIDELKSRGALPDVDDSTGYLRKIHEARKIGRYDLAEMELEQAFREVLGVVL